MDDPELNARGRKKGIAFQEDRDESLDDSRRDNRNTRESISRWVALAFFIAGIIMVAASQAFARNEPVGVADMSHLGMPVLLSSREAVGAQFSQSAKEKGVITAHVRSPQVPTLSSPLYAFFLLLGHVPVPVDVADFRSGGEVSRAAVAALALPAKLGRAVTAADVRVFLISREEALRLVADSSRVTPEAEKGVPIGALAAFDSATLSMGTCLLLELKDADVPIAAVRVEPTRPPHFRAVMLILASHNNEIYRNARRVWLTYIDREPSIKIFFIYGRGSVPQEELTEHDLQFEDIEENYNPGMILKTQRAMEEIVERRNYTFDFFIRTNISTLWNLMQLLEHLKTLPTQLCYSGHGPHGENTYVSGTDTTVNGYMVPEF